MPRKDALRLLPGGSLPGIRWVRLFSISSVQGQKHRQDDSVHRPCPVVSAIATNCSWQSYLEYSGRNCCRLPCLSAGKNESQEIETDTYV